MNYALCLLLYTSIISRYTPVIKIPYRKIQKKLCMNKINIKQCISVTITTIT